MIVETRQGKRIRLKERGDTYVIDSGGDIDRFIQVSSIFKTTMKRSYEAGFTRGVLIGSFGMMVFVAFLIFIA